MLERVFRPASELPVLLVQHILPQCSHQRKLSSPFFATAKTPYLSLRLHTRAICLMRHQVSFKKTLCFRENEKGDVLFDEMLISERLAKTVLMTQALIREHMP